ncbi:hypothetical protein T11_13730 [Trichinella zimbabwensis]|uniref:Uncharacterized protein n=1 Tax=Trichinella zimbabwensis TaxID=268475 RepID=A0A0V1GTC5_9BILA|nr:hypothetical protein T11_13730 [Trichinella zimbabwensis]
MIPPERKQYMAPSKIAVEASSFHSAVDIAFFNVSVGEPFMDKLKLLAPDSRFFRQIIDFSDILPEKSIICLKNLESGANSFNLSINGSPTLTLKNAMSTAL